MPVCTWVSRIEKDHNDVGSYPFKDHSLASKIDQNENQTEEERKTHLKQDKILLKTNERSKHRSQTKKCNSVLEFGFGCVCCVRNHLQTFHFLHCYFSLFFFFVFIFRHSQSKNKRRQFTQTSYTHQREEKKRKEIVDKRKQFVVVFFTSG